MFDALLQPHCSLGPKGFYLLICVIATLSFTIGIFFAINGAWPILGFFGLDVLAVYVALRLSYRNGNLKERVTLMPNELTVLRTQPKGNISRWEFNPYWVRVHVFENRFGNGYVALCSHGKEVRLGTFLTSSERVDFARSLEAAIQETLKTSIAAQPIQKPSTSFIP